MTTELPLLENSYFYNMESPFTKRGRIDEKTFYENASIKTRTYKKIKINGTFYDDCVGSLQAYKSKYIMFTESEKSKKVIFDKKYDYPVHSISINIENLYKIKSLPKDLLVFMLQGGPDLIKFNVNTIPKNIVSMKFLASAFPFNGADLSKLKNLKYFSVDSKHLVVLPKFPKSIEYVYIRGSNLSFHPSAAFKNFKLKDYPNLKGIVLKDTGLSIKDIPKDILSAKKSKKIKVYIK